MSDCCIGAVSAYAKQEFSAVQDTDDTDGAQLEGSCERKWGTLKAKHIWVQLVLNMSMSCSVLLCSALPRQSAQEKDC